MLRACEIVSRCYGISRVVMEFFLAIQVKEHGDMKIVLIRTVVPFIFRVSRLIRIHREDKEIVLLSCWKYLP